VVIVTDLRLAFACVALPPPPSRVTRVAWRERKAVSLFPLLSHEQDPDLVRVVPLLVKRLRKTKTCLLLSCVFVFVFQHNTKNCVLGFLC